MDASLLLFAALAALGFLAALYGALRHRPAWWRAGFLFAAGASAGSGLLELLQDGRGFSAAAHLLAGLMFVGIALRGAPASAVRG
ncbi:hypothetical protein G8A07_03345 [Roseateles sp. DAIF2]|uniref:hypothetical protein n=1 Tax=Roseateles sp. DAIF2 TaxID=2714952 RepID=UPI0018A31396|nr:hypothetical protein [Roseateles sp. DAIF2]QPF72062.1 hypothetical protein G8A07_03345 [Roseateles sp. DAIF2]